MSRIPQTDSIEEIARFWDSHDLTEYEDDLEEAKEPVFKGEPRTVVRVPLEPDQAAALHRMAQAKGVEEAALVQEWVNEKLTVP